MYEMMLMIGLTSDLLFRQLVCVTFNGRHDVNDWSDL
jgi:hypothetical protein